MKYCLFIDVDFTANAALLADALRRRDEDASFCVLQGTTPNVTDEFFASLPADVPVPRTVPDLNAEEAEWPVHGDASLLPDFEKRLGSEKINQCQIAGKYMGDGYLRGGRIPWSPLHAACRTNEAQRRYLSGMLTFFYEYFEREKPDVLFCPWVDRTYLAGMVHVANDLGIPFRRIVISRVGGYYALSPGMQDVIPQVKRSYDEFVRQPNLADAWIEEARTYARTFRENPQPPGYKAFSTRKLHGRLRLRDMAVLAAQALTPGYEPKGVQVPYPANVLKAYVQRRLRMRCEFEKPRWKGWEGVRDEPFAYYPLHYDPEASTMAYNPMITNQFAMIEALAKSIPPSWTLAVKEHSLMIGRRPPEMYDALERVPKVELIHPMESSFAMTQSSQFTATISGTVGLESMLLGKVPFYMGRSFVQDIGEGFVLCSDMEAMPAAVERAMETAPVREERLELFLAAIIANSFAFPIQMVQESSREFIPNETRRAAMDNIAAHLIRSL